MQVYYNSCHIILSSCVYCVQDCFATIPPYPYYLGDPEEFNLSLQLDEVMYGRPIGLYSAKLRPFSETDTSRDYTIDIVYFSAMEPLDLPQRNPMQSEARFKLLYEPGPSTFGTIASYWICFQYLVSGAIGPMLP